jgi:hypothetical protein
MPEPQIQRVSACGGGCPKCQEEQFGHEHERLQTKQVQSSDLEQSPIPPIVQDVLRSPGQPLDPATRAFMEPGFGHDFSRVRVHADPKAAQSTRALNALAYTVGQDLVFGAGQYAPETYTGKRLIAHELAHVLQQRSAQPPYRNTIQLYQDCPRHNPNISNPDDTIRTARNAATPIVSQALQSIQIASTTGTPESAAFNYIFHNPNQQQIQKISEVYTNLSGWLPGIESFICNSQDVCEQESEEGREITYAYLGQCRGVIVHICPAFFNSLGPHEQALAMIHEGAHHFGVCGSPERYFGETQFPPENAANVCPDSYANFVDQVALEGARRPSPFEERPVRPRSR